MGLLLPPLDKQTVHFGRPDIRELDFLLFGGVTPYPDLAAFP